MKLRSLRQQLTGGDCNFTVPIGGESVHFKFKCLKAEHIHMFMSSAQVQPGTKANVAKEIDMIATVIADCLHHVSKEGEHPAFADKQEALLFLMRATQQSKFPDAAALKARIDGALGDMLGSDTSTSED